MFAIVSSPSGGATPRYYSIPLLYPLACDDVRIVEFVSVFDAIGSVVVRILSAAKRKRCVIFNVDIPLPIGFRAARAVVFVRSARCDETVRETQNAARINPWRVARGDSDDEFAREGRVRARADARRQTLVRVTKSDVRRLTSDTNIEERR